MTTTVFEMRVSRSSSTLILLSILVSSLSLLPKTDGQSTTTGAANKVLTNKLRVTTKVWLMESTDPQIVAAAMTTCAHLADILREMTGGDHLMEIYWRMWSVNLTLYAKSSDNIMEVFSAIGNATSTNANDLKDIVLHYDLRKEYAGRPEISLHWLADDGTATDWTKNAKERANNTAAEKNADMVLVATGYKWDDGNTRAIIYTNDADNQFDELGPLDGGYLENMKPIVKKLAEKIQQLLESCRCKMVGDGVCYFLFLYDESEPAQSDCVDRSACVSEWRCVETVPKSSRHKKYCSAGKILRPCENDYDVCSDRCDHAPTTVVEPCNATCKEPNGMEHVILTDLRYRCCAPIIAGETKVKEDKGWKACTVDKEKCPKPQTRHFILGIVFVVIAVLFIAGLAACVFLIMRLRRTSQMTTDTSVMKSVSKSAKGAVTLPPTKAGESAKSGSGQKTPAKSGPGQPKSVKSGQGQPKSVKSGQGQPTSTKSGPAQTKKSMK